MVSEYMVRLHLPGLVGLSRVQLSIILIIIIIIIIIIILLTL